MCRDVSVPSCLGHCPSFLVIGNQTWGLFTVVRKPAICVWSNSVINLDPTSLVLLVIKGAVVHVHKQETGCELWVRGLQTRCTTQVQESGKLCWLLWKSGAVTLKWPHMCITSWPGCARHNLYYGRSCWNGPSAIMFFEAHHIVLQGCQCEILSVLLNLSALAPLFLWALQRVSV